MANDMLSTERTEGTFDPESLTGDSGIHGWEQRDPDFVTDLLRDWSGREESEEEVSWRQVVAATPVRLPEAATGEEVSWRQVVAATPVRLPEAAWFKLAGRVQVLVTLGDLPYTVEGFEKLLAVKKAAAVASLDSGQRILKEEFSAACREAIAFAQQMATGRVEVLSPALLALAKQAAGQCAARKNEDVEAWAERLARDVGDATD